MLYRNLYPPERGIQVMASETDDVVERRVRREEVSQEGQGLSYLEVNELVVVERVEAAAASTSDFDRPVHCVLGMAFDLLSLPQAVARLRKALANEVGFVLTTPNTNFLVEAIRNPEFRDSLFCSNLSVVDGMPIVVLGRLLGVPFQERVAGSDLFDALQVPDGAAKPSTVFYFGGQDGVAAEAHRKTNETPGHLTSVGSLSPGFGSIDSLSSDGVISRINDAAPGFLVVSIGAVRGQEWIARNVSKLDVAVVAGLGAVVNFMAQRVKRAPPKFRMLGLEWMWRTIQEPTLFHRYRRDAIRLGQLTLTKVLPYSLLKLTDALVSKRVEPQCRVLVRGQHAVIAMSGWVSANSGLETLRAALKDVAEACQSVRVMADGLQSLDSATLGLLLVMRGHALRHGGDLTIVNPSPRVARILSYQCLGYLIRRE